MKRKHANLSRHRTNFETREDFQSPDFRLEVASVRFMSYSLDSIPSGLSKHTRHMVHNGGTISTVADSRLSGLANRSGTTNDILTLTNESTYDGDHNNHIFEQQSPKEPQSRYRERYREEEQQQKYQQQHQQQQQQQRNSISPINVNEEENKDHDDKSSKPQFECTIGDVQILHDLISSIQLFGNFCMLDIYSEGMCFSINESNICKIRLNINKKIFKTYTFNGLWRAKTSFSDEQLYGEDTFVSQDEEENGAENFISDDFDKDAVVSINLNLELFLEMINIHVKDRKSTEKETECTFKFHREGDPFVLKFEDDFIIEQCELKTYFKDETTVKKTNKKNQKKNTDETNDNEENTEKGIINDFEVDNIVDDSIFRLNSRTVLYDIIIKSPVLYDIIKDMRGLNTENFILYCKKNKDNQGSEKGSKVIFISKSISDNIGLSKLIIDDRKKNLPEFKLLKPISIVNSNEYEFQECYNLSLSSTYRFSYFSKLRKAIRLSRLIKIRKDMSGITSLLLLLGGNSMTQKKQQANPQQIDYDELYGSSIEFVTCESISIDELSALGTSETRSTSLLSKLGYGDKFVEQLIKDDREVQTIRIGNDGQLVTLDDYFGFHNNADAEFDEIENAYNMHGRETTKTPDRVREPDDGMFNNDYDASLDISVDDGIAADYMPIEFLGSKTSSSKNKHQDNNILQLTEQLTMSLLGHEAPIAACQRERNHDVEVEQTIIENESDNEDGDRRKRASNNRRDAEANKRNKVSRGVSKGKGKKGPSSGSRKKKNDGIETVGGAIEIPLFI